MSSIKSALIAWGVSLVIFAGIYGYAEVFGPASVPSDREAAPADSEDNPPVGASTEQSTAGDTAVLDDDPFDAGEQDTGANTDTPDPASIDAPETTAGRPDQDPLLAPVSTTDAAQPAAPEAPTLTAMVEHPGAFRVADNLEEARQGELPKISNTGVTPFEAYRTPAPERGDVPRIAIIITELGLRARTTQRAVAQLPHQVTLAFSPYGTRLQEWAEQARASGHELLMMVPMEPVNYPQMDPGPLALLVSQTVRSNIDLLRSSLGTMTGYVGIINHMGSRFTASTGQIEPIISEIGARGLMLVDARTSRQSRAADLARSKAVPTAINDSDIDREPRADDILARLQDLETRARSQGAAVGVGRAFPVTVNTVRDWAAGLTERGILLVPVSHVADLQPLPR